MAAEGGGASRAGKKNDLKRRPETAVRSIGIARGKGRRDGGEFFAEGGRVKRTGRGDLPSHPLPVWKNAVSSHSRQGWDARGEEGEKRRRAMGVLQTLDERKRSGGRQSYEIRASYGSGLLSWKKRGRYSEESTLNLSHPGRKKGGVDPSR